MGSDDKITLSGKVVEVLPGTKFKVELENTKMTQVVTAHLSGKMKRHNIRIIVGDMVDLEVSVYNLLEGRIVYRHTKQQLAPTVVASNTKQKKSKKK